jgi:hypothetical protein
MLYYIVKLKYGLIVPYNAIQNRQMTGKVFIMCIFCHATTIANAHTSAEELQRAMDIVKTISCQHDGEKLTVAVLKNEEAPEELVELALQKFFELSQTIKLTWWNEASYVVCVLLWKQGRRDWLKRMYEIVFRSDFKYETQNSPTSFVSHFLRFARWDDHPEDYSLTKETLCWDEYYLERKRAIQSRLEAGRFETEADYTAWRAGQGI